MGSPAQKPLFDPGTRATIVVVAVIMVLLAEMLCSAGQYVGSI